VAGLVRLVMLVTEGRGLNSRCFGLVTYVEVVPRYVRGALAMRSPVVTPRVLYTVTALR
jgi:hypothetical protein